jgi:hypothetical protein
VTLERPPLAVMCAAAHPLAPECLCRRLRLHAGIHTFDGLPPWTADTTAKEDPMPAPLIADETTAGYTRCAHCWEVYDVAPGEPFTCPDPTCVSHEDDA